MAICVHDQLMIIVIKMIIKGISVIAWHYESRNIQRWSLRQNRVLRIGALTIYCLVIPLREDVFRQNQKGSKKEDAEGCHIDTVVVPWFILLGNTKLQHKKLNVTGFFLFVDLEHVIFAVFPCIQYIDTSHKRILVALDKTLVW